MNDTDNPIVDLLTVRRDLYLVMSLLLADERVAKVHNVVAWTRDFYENEVRRLTLWVATAARGLLDLQEKRKDTFSKQYCGEYWADFENSKKTALTFRQACNSVIHAKEILPYRDPKPDNKKARQVYTDRMTIRSTNRGRTSRAQLDIIKFVWIAYELTRSFEKDRYANG